MIGRVKERMSWNKNDLNLLDDFILGYTNIETQQELADILDKPLNAIKIRISRRKKEEDFLEKKSKMLNMEEYKIVLSNRFDKTTKEIAEILNVTENFLFSELDEIDCLECSEYLEDDFHSRIMTLEEILLLIKFYKKGKNIFQIAHILNRPIHFIEEKIKEINGGKNEIQYN